MSNLGCYTFWSKQSEILFSTLLSMTQKLWISSKVFQEQLVKLSRALWLSGTSLSRTYIEVSFCHILVLLFSTLR